MLVLNHTPKIDYLFWQVPSKFDEATILSVRDVRRIIDDARLLDVHRLAFYGSDLSRNDKLFEIIEYAKQKKVKSIVIFDNFPSFGAIDRFVDTGIDAAVLRLPNKKIRRDTGSGLFDKKVKALIKKFRHSPIPLAVSIVATSENVSKLPGICSQLALAGVFEFIVERSPRQNIDFDLLAKAYLELVNVSKGRINLRIRDPLFYTLPEIISQMKSEYGDMSKIVAGCSAGISICAIDSFGNLLPCDKSNLIVGNLLKTSLLSLWTDSDVFQKLRNRDLSGICADCNFMFLCGGCRECAYQYNGNFFDSDPLCPKTRGVSIENTFG